MADDFASYDFPIGPTQDGTPLGAANVSWPTLYSSAIGPTQSGAPLNGSSDPSFMSQYGKYLGLGIPIGGLALAGLAGLQPIPYQKQIQADASQLRSEGSQLMQPLLTGAPLPTGAEATIQGGLQGSQAAILSNAAATGAGLGSSSTQQQLIQAQLTAQQARFNEAQTLYTMGSKELVQGDSMLATLGAERLKQDEMLSSSIGKIAGMFATKELSDLFK